MRARRALLVALHVAALARCAAEEPARDVTERAATARDATEDEAASDASGEDAAVSSRDAVDEAALDAPRDADVRDGAGPDAAVFDARADATVREASAVDASTLDASARDASVADSGTRDASTADAHAADTSEAGVGCPAGAVAIDDFCIDRYEAPNEPGAAPLAMQTALDGERWCVAHGRQLCTEAQWQRACQGAAASAPDARRFPYGATYARGRCNDDKTWRSPSWSVLATWPSAAAMAEARRLYQADPSGEREGCVSREGVFDLTGNVAEWVRRSFPTVTGYDHVLRGCYWAGCYGGAPPSCTFVNSAHPSGFRTYEAGFRCCSPRR